MSPDDLYAIDPEEFVAERDRLVRDLKRTDPDEAARVKKLRKPTVAAWAINVVAREHGTEVAALLAAGDRLRAAQEKALRGDAGALRTATEERRAAVARVADLAAEVLGDRASAQASAVSATLEAATVDEGVADLVRAGTLDKERSAAAAGFGFGDVGDWTPPPPRPKPAKEQAKQASATPAKPEPKKPDDALAKQLAAATAEAKARAAELHEAEVRLRDLKREVTAATEAVRQARTKAQRAELQVEQLRQRAWEVGDRGR